jgi:hypothetical protein
MRRRSAFPRAPTPARPTRAEPIERVRAAFGDEAFGRLHALKRRYDPNNLLRQNRKIPPLGDGVASR